jgi:hypothetical protein
LAIIEVRDPEAKEKETTPISYKRMQIILSVGVTILMSPYPTVVMVYMTK